MSIAFNAGFNHYLNDTQSRKDAEQKTTATPFRDYLAPSAATTPDKTSLVTSTMSSKAAVLEPVAAVGSTHNSESNGFVQAMEQMLGMAQGSINTGVSDKQHNSLDSKALLDGQIASPFQDSLSILGTHSADKTSKVSASVVTQTAEFDPFSVVRSGAVPEDNAFVLALKRLYGLVGDPLPVAENPSITTVQAAPVVTEPVQAKPINVDLPSTTDHLSESITGLSQLISDSIEHSATSAANQEFMDTVLNKLS